ncbi:MAG: hypothetical protein ACR2PL_25495 [Dehalococcoidia bacterium]
MTGLQPALDLLAEALQQPEQRKQLLWNFREAVWQAPEAPSEQRVAWDILEALAYQLEFYEPCLEWREEDSSYYGDADVEAKIRLALRQLHAPANGPSEYP